MFPRICWSDHPTQRMPHYMNLLVAKFGAQCFEVVDKIVLSEPERAGYGPLQVRLWKTEPGLYYGVYRTTEPIFGKSMFGVGRLDLRSRHLETFEFGPTLRLGVFALSPDKTRAYAVARNTGASGELNDLLVLDMENARLLVRKEGFEQGRPNGSLIVHVETHTVGFCRRRRHASRASTSSLYARWDRSVLTETYQSFLFVGSAGFERALHRTWVLIGDTPGVSNPRHSFARSELCWQVQFGVQVRLYLAFA